MQVLEMIKNLWRAVQESNLRPSASETGRHYDLRHLDTATTSKNRLFLHFNASAMITVMITVAGCGEVSHETYSGPALHYPGITFANTDESFSHQAERMIGLMGNELGVDLGAALKTLDVRVTAQLSAVNCDGKMATGCTWQRGHYDVVLMLTYGERITESAFAHEMAHVYACAVDGECDPNHKRREIWEATGRAAAKFK